jgi:hypothetical protein
MEIHLPRLGTLSGSYHSKGFGARRYHLKASQLPRRYALDDTSLSAAESRSTHTKLSGTTLNGYDYHGDTPTAACRSRRQTRIQRTRSPQILPQSITTTAEIQLGRCVSLDGRVEVNHSESPDITLKQQEYHRDIPSIALHSRRRHERRPSRSPWILTSSIGKVAEIHFRQRSILGGNMRFH